MKEDTVKKAIGPEADKLQETILRGLIAGMIPTPKTKDPAGEILVRADGMRKALEIDDGEWSFALVTLAATTGPADPVELRSYMIEMAAKAAQRVAAVRADMAQQAEERAHDQGALSEMAAGEKAEAAAGEAAADLGGEG